MMEGRVSVVLDPKLANLKMLHIKKLLVYCFPTSGSQMKAVRSVGQNWVPPSQAPCANERPYSSVDLARSLNRSSSSDPLPFAGLSALPMHPLASRSFEEIVAPIAWEVAATSLSLPGPLKQTFRPNGSPKFTGSPLAKPYRLSPPTKPMGSSCVNRPVEGS